MEFGVQDSQGNTYFKYSEQLSKLAHREQISMYIELDDVNDFDNELANAIITNTRRYNNLLSDIVYEILPSFVQRDIIAKDALDVYIEHRLMMENRIRQPNDQRDARNKFPQELMRR